MLCSPANRKERFGHAERATGGAAVKGDGLLVAFGCGAIAVAAATLLFGDARWRRDGATERAQAGRWTLVYSGRAHCAEPCSRVLVARMNAARNDLGAKARLVGPILAISDRAADIPAQAGGAQSDNSLALIDPTGRVVATFPGSLPERDLARQLASLVH